MLESPAEDFSKKTLGAVPGALGKLQYLAGLRQHNGEYFHWGMARIHGEANASVAIGQAHTNLFLTILRTPIRALWDDAAERAREQGSEIRDYVKTLTETGDGLMPVQLQGGGRRHFNSILLALCSLAGVPAPKAGRAA